MENRENLWSDLGKYIKEKLVKPWQSPSFVLYFIFIVLIVGALGIHLAYFSSKFPDTKDGNIISNMNCYFLTLVSTSALALLLMNHGNLSKALSVISFGIITISILLFVLSTKYESYLISCVGIVLSIITWWIANADNHDLHDDSYYKNVRESSNKLSKDW